MRTTNTWRRLGISSLVVTITCLYFGIWMWVGQQISDGLFDRYVNGLPTSLPYTGQSSMQASYIRLLQDRVDQLLLPRLLGAAVGGLCLLVIVARFYVADRPVREHRRLVRSRAG